MMVGDLLGRLERAFEQIFEGLFAHTFRGRVQPVEIARRLSRSMEAHKMVSVSQVYAPNEFEVVLHPEDYQTLQPFEAAIMPELAKHVEARAAEARYGLLGKPAIRFREDPDVARGEIEIEALFVRKDEQGIQHTDHPTTALDPAVVPGLRSSARAILHAVEGPDAGDEFPLVHAVTTIGRGGTNHVALSDTNVSRAHAEVELRPDGYHLKDLGSKNGSFVNGVPAKDRLLSDGDTITVGATTFEFKSVRTL